MKGPNILCLRGIVLYCLAEMWQVLKVPNGIWGLAGWGFGVTWREEGQLEPVITHYTKWLVLVEVLETGLSTWARTFEKLWEVICKDRGEIMLF